MKKLMLLIPILLLSYKASSQPGTQKDSIVSLKSPIAREVIKELITCDGCKEELNQVNLALTLTKEKVTLKDQIISLQLVKINNLENIQINIQEQLELQKKITQQVQYDLKVQKKKTFLFKVTTVVGVLTTGYILLAK